MASVRKTIISNCEKNFLNKILSEHTRLDGRAFNECRNVEITFGKDWGCCLVSLGKTKVIAQVSCELQQPKSSRPNEGILNINLELNPMADPSFEAGRPSELSSQLNRLLEKCIKDSKAVDLESLCVKMNERAWSFRVDINVLNHEGNILDCASIAALTALAHFRRPDVTCDGEEYKIHSIKQRDPIPTVIHHYPVCISYAIINQGEFILADPTLLEEGVAEAFLTISLNAYKELCGLHLGGNAHISARDILDTANKASKRALELVEIIKEVVEKDTQDRLSMKNNGFLQLFDSDTIDVPLSELRACLDHWNISKSKKKKKQAKDQENKEDGAAMDIEPVQDVNNSESNVNEKESEWKQVVSDEEAEADVIYVDPVAVETIAIPDSDSEEERVVILNPQKKNRQRKGKNKS